VAVIGVGSLGRHHARILAGLPEAELVAVVDRDPDRAREIAAHHSVSALTDPRDLPPDLEAVTVAAPTIAHAAIAGTCLRRGWAVLVEKPMTATLEEAEALIEIERSAGRPLLVGHTERFNPVVRAVAPEVRDPRFIEAHRLGAFTSRSTDVDVVLDLMIHDLDVITSLVPSAVAAVDAVGVSALTDKPDIANARIRFENGCVANVTASRISTERVRKLRIFEADSYVSMDYAQQVGVRFALRARGEGRPEIVRQEIQVETEEPLAVEMRSFLLRVRGRSAPGVTAGEGLRALRMAFQILSQIGGAGRPSGEAHGRPGEDR
jgi:predicted dehydrogenase